MIRNIISNIIAGVEKSHASLDSLRLYVDNFEVLLTAIISFPYLLRGATRKMAAPPSDYQKRRYPFDILGITQETDIHRYPQYPDQLFQLQYQVLPEHLRLQ